MKKFISIFVFISALCTSCEEVIDLKLDSQEQQLVIDARIDWKKGESKAFPIVHLSHTRDYYSNLPSQKVSGALITITTNDGSVYPLEEITTNDITTNIQGFYLDIPFGEGGSFYIYKGDFYPALGQEYFLTITYQNETYTSKARMQQAPEIDKDRIEQRNNGGIFGNKKEIKFFFDGFEGETNDYMVKMNIRNKTEYFTLDDSFLASKKFFFITDGLGEDLEMGDTINVSLYRISSEYAQIVKLLLNASAGDDDGGGRPSYTIPSRVFGNIVHTTNPEKNPLGAFRVTQYTQTKYVVEQ